MLLIFLVVFVAVFAMVVLVMMASSGRAKRTETVRATLDAVLLKGPRPATDEVVDVRKNSALSAIPWMDRLLARVRLATDLRRVLDQADLSWTPGRVLFGGVACWLVTFYVMRTRADSPMIAFLLGLPAAAAPLLYVLNKRQRRFQRFQQKLPDALDLMVSALRAGNSTMGALGIVAREAPEPIRREFRICFDEQSYGVDLRAAMANLVSRVPLPDMRIITTAILIQKESGGDLAQVLDNTSQVIRARFRLLDQIRVHSAQGRLTGWILTAMPLGLGLLLSVINPQYIDVLLTRPLGHRLMLTGAVMNVIGLLVIRKIVRIKV
jgi:tight adherence protein B